MFSKPKIGIILGTGLGGLVEKLQVELEIPYQDIPNFPVSTVSSHKGTWIFGKFNGVDVVVLNGRFHYYEGYTLNEVTMPIQIMKEIGIEKLILSNAAGGMNPAFKIGDIMIITDHINFFGINPLIGPNDDNLGPRFPDMSEAYSKELINICFNLCKKNRYSSSTGCIFGIKRSLL
jgi:purine-nucleoside phosphorylase